MQAGQIMENILCPVCNPPVELRVRVNSENGSRFLGCANYPRCRHSQELPAFERMKAAGAPMLPGFD